MFHKLCLLRSHFKRFVLKRLLTERLHRWQGDIDELYCHRVVTAVCSCLWVLYMYSHTQWNFFFFVITFCVSSLILSWYLFLSWYPVLKSISLKEDCWCSKHDEYCCIRECFSLVLWQSFYYSHAGWLVPVWDLCSDDRRKGKSSLPQLLKDKNQS